MENSTSFIRLEKKEKSLRGQIRLDGSKSLSNRAAIILALAGQRPTDFLENISTSKDTQILLQLLENQGDTFDAGDAGTTFRFLTAYLASRPGTQILTGSARMKERPVGNLVAALRDLGADIEFIENEGFPPLKIGEPRNFGVEKNEVKIHAGTSSQFLSALLLIAPTLPNGLVLHPEGAMVSRSYLEMTVKMMRFFGAEVSWENEKIAVRPGKYLPQKLSIEADWSAASYWFSMVSLSDEADLKLVGLHENSWQGDAVVAKMMEKLGVESRFENGFLILKKSEKPLPPVFEQDFLDCPDIAQTLAVACAGLGVQAVFSGLETLSIKETDRILALKNELKKVGVTFSKLPARFSKKQVGKTFFLLDGKANWSETPRFSTYGDHRMAMAFAPLAFLDAVEIENPEVVKKSYPKFWDDLESVGFSPKTA